MQIKKKDSYFVYMVRCRYGTYYSGYTVDLEARISAHNSGKGAKYLRGRAPVELVYHREYRYLSQALKAERALKKLKRREKEALAGEHAENILHNSTMPDPDCMPQASSRNAEWLPLSDRSR